ncbi:MAG: hypothetical protein LBV60_20770 [Streptomyces sp.]|jgi:hypothetical protein|nr:hypothetical protein [Streptomyces sp.]
MTRAVDALRLAREEAEANAAIGESAKVQARLALAVAFTDPERADDEVDLAHRLLARTHLRSTTLTARGAALVRDAGRAEDVPDRATVLLAEIGVAGVKSAEARLRLALCFHHAVRADDVALTAALSGLRTHTADGYFAHYAEAAHFLAAVPLPDDWPRARWVDGEAVTRARWRGLVLARRQLVGVA